MERNVALELSDLVESFDKNYLGSDTVYKDSNAFLYEFEYNGSKCEIVLHMKRDLSCDRCGFVGDLSEFGQDDGGAIVYCPKCEWIVG